MKLHQLIAPLLLVLVASGCTTYSFGHRDREADPDKRLAGLLDKYDKLKSGEKVDDDILQDTDRVRLEIERMSLEFPTHVPTLMANAVLAYDAREVTKSQRYLDMLFHLQAAHPDAAVLRSHIAIDDGNLPLARHLLETQIQFTPDHAGLHEAYSGALYMGHDLEGATSQINLAERLGAPPARVAFNRGLIAEAGGKDDEARKQYQAALDADPGFAGAQSRLSGMKAKPGYNNPSAAPGKAGGG
jgi:tetratricopeptide (TPR) repeat protein